MSSKIGTVLIDVAADVSKLVDGFNKAQKESKEKSEKIVSYAKNITAAFAGMYTVKESYDAIASSGFAFNKNMEEATVGLMALTVATSENISAMGKHLSITEKYNLAQVEAKKTAEALDAINAQTPHALQETNQIYKAMYISMKNAGASNEEMINLTKQISIAAGAAGIEFNSLLAGVDGLATGTVEANSDFGRFLGGLGLTNEALKKSSNIVALLNEKFKDFKSLDTMSVATSNLENAWSQLAGTLTEDIFEDAKNYANELSNFLNSVTNKLNYLGTLSKKREEFALISEIEKASSIFEQLEVKMQKAMSGGFGAGNFENIKKEAEQAKNELDNLTSSYIRLYGQPPKEIDTLKPKKIIKEDEELIKLKKKYYEEIKKMDDKSHLYFLDNQAKEALETYKHYEALKEEYKTVAGARDKLTTLQNQELKNIETKQLAELNEEKLNLQKKFVDEANALVEKNNAFYLDGLTKEALEIYEHYNSLIEEYKTIAGAEQALRTMQGEALDDINKKIEEQNRLAAQKTLIDSLDEVNDRYQKILESQISLIEAGQDWGINFSGDAKNIDNISKSISKMHLLSIKYTKADLDLQNDYAKKFLTANGDIAKEKITQAEFDEDYSKLNEQRKTSEIAGYAALAGSMAQAFSEGSDAAKAFMAVQQGLALYNSVTAVTAAWASAPFPANLPAVAATTAAVISLLAQIGTSFSASGVGSAPTENFEANRQSIEDSYTPMTDRLDRQIELLESIDRQGSASAISAELAGVNFARDYKLWIEDTLESARLSGATKLTLAQTEAAMSNVEGMSGVDIYSANANGSQIGLNTDALREDFNMLKALIATINTGWWGLLGQKDLTGSESERWQQQKTQMTLNINEAQNLISEWALGIVESMDDLKDAAKDFKGYYDNITGSMFYETARLKQAYAEVDALRGENSFADYLQHSINSIESLQSFFNDEVFTLLSSQDINDIEAQIAKVEELQTVTGKTFEGGAREALNYLESIELVAEAMAKSRENIKSFTDNLLTDEQLAKNLASSMGVSLATSVDGLAALFYNLSEDMDGLTDSDLDLLNANKALLENTDKYQEQIDSLNVTLDDVTGSISTLDGVLGVIQSTIDKLRSASLTSEQSLQIFYDAMAAAQALSTTTLYEEYASAIKRASNASSILFNTSAFQTSRDMQFAQLVAANQFEDLQNTTLSEIDYLKQIEINTRTQIDVLVEAMNSLGTNVSSSLSSAISSIGQAKTSRSSTASYISDIYTKYDLNKYQTDTSGYAYWEQQVASGAVAVQDLDEAIRVAAIERLMYTPFADGGIVTAPTFSLIGEAGYPEAVIPLKNPDDPLSVGMLVNEIRDLKNQVATLLEENNKNQAQISKNTAASRYTS